MKSSILKNILIVLLFLFSTETFAQLSNTVSDVKIGIPKENQDLSFQVTLFQSTGINKIILFYKTFGENEFEKQELSMTGVNASTVIPGKYLIPPYIEYYLVVYFENGKEENYPLDYPLSPAIQIQVQTSSLKDKEVLIMSPEPNSQITLADFFVSISLLRASDDVKKDATKIYIDGTDVTSLALFAEDLIMFYAENFPGTIKSGYHTLTVELFDNSGSSYHSVSTNFTIVPSDFAQFSKSDVKYYVKFKGESRNENIANNTAWYNNMTLNSGLEYKGWNLDGKLYITSEEKKYLQPNNRYLISLSSDFIKLSYGDDFPTLPNLILNGKRVRGFYGDLRLGFFNLQTSVGEITRGIEGRVIDTIPRSLKQLGNDIIKLNEMYDARIIFGTYQRKIFAIRPSFGSGENFQWGFSYLHGIDDKKSINLSARPQENLVFGTDMLLAFDDQKFMLTGQAAFSLSNSDISSGNFTSEQIDNLTRPDSLFAGQKDIIKNLVDYLGSMITVNQFLKPLNPQELATFSADGALQLNYFNNFLKLSYIYRGNDFQSFGQSITRTDIAGINFTDRLRLLENRLFISFGYENLSDNLQKTKQSTTTFQTISTSVSLFPRVDAPNFVLSYTANSNKNTISLPPELIGQYNLIDSLSERRVPGYDRKLLYAVDDNTNRFGMQITYDFFWGYKHQAGLNFSISDRKDKSALNYDINNSSFMITSNSTWSDDFSSNFNISINNAKIESKNVANNKELSYASISLGGRYLMLQNKLILTGAFAPSFGDLERQTLDLFAQYYILNNFSLSFQFRFINQKNFSDTIVGLMTVYEI